MKNTTIVLLFILSTLFSNAQNKTEAIKVRAYEATMFSKVLQETSGWEKTNILIVFGFLNDNLDKISVYASKSDKYSIVNFKKTYKDENNISWFIYKGINENGEEYTIEWGQFTNFKQKQIGTLLMYNQDGLGFIYNLKLDD